MKNKWYEAHVRWFSMQSCSHEAFRRFFSQLIWVKYLLVCNFYNKVRLRSIHWLSHSISLMLLSKARFYWNKFRCELSSMSSVCKNVENSLTLWRIYFREILLLILVFLGFIHLAQQCQFAKIISSRNMNNFFVVVLLFSACLLSSEVLWIWWIRRLLTNYLFDI